MFQTTNQTLHCIYPGTAAGLNHALDQIARGLREALARGACSICLCGNRLPLRSNCYIIIWLVVSIRLKNMKVNWDDYCHVPVTTNQSSICP